MGNRPQMAVLEGITRKEKVMGLEQTFLNLLIGSVARISEPLRIATRETVAVLYAKAQATPNPYDNIVVDLLANLLGVDIEEPEKKEQEKRE